MWPALVVNPDWLGAGPFGWKMVASGGILCAALFIEGSRHVRPRYLGLAVFAAGLVGGYCNTIVAMKSASHASEADSHARKTNNLAAKTASSQSSQASRRRVELVKLAGETPSATYEADITAAINVDIRRWIATSECKDIQAKASGTYCAGIATLQGKLKAAQDREKLDEGAKGGGQNQTLIERSEDPFADTFPKFMAGFGLKVDRENATAHLIGIRSVWLELMALFGFAVILAIFDVVDRADAALSRLDPLTLKPNVPAGSTKSQTVDISVTPAPEPKISKEAVAEAAKAKEADVQRRHAAFVADELETWNGVSMRTSEPWGMWKRRCASRGEDPGGQRSFTQRLSKNFTHDPDLKGHRPRFLNVRAKVKGPRLAVSNPRSIPITVRQSNPASDGVPA